DIEDLASDGKDRLGVRVARLLGRSRRRVALDDEQLRLARVAGRTVGQLVGQAAGLEPRLAPGQFPGLAGRLPGFGGVDRLLDDPSRLWAVALQPLGQAAVEDLLHIGAYLGVAELCLRLPLELGMTDAHRDDGGQALPDVL